MTRGFLWIGLISLVVTGVACSDRRSSAVISFEQAIAEGSAFGGETKISRMGTEEEVIETLDGKSPKIDPKKSYGILYSNPTMIASIQCLANRDDAEKEYDVVLDNFTDGKHPLKLDSHENLGMEVPAIGFWNEEEKGSSQKQVIFLYGNLVVVIQTFFSSPISVEEVREFATDYVAYLDTVAK